MQEQLEGKPEVQEGMAPSSTTLPTSAPEIERWGWSGLIKGRRWGENSEFPVLLPPWGHQCREKDGGTCTHTHPGMSASVFSSPLLPYLLWPLFSMLAHSELWMINTLQCLQPATRKGALCLGGFSCCDLSLVPSLPADPLQATRLVLSIGWREGEGRKGGGFS